VTIRAPGPAAATPPWAGRSAPADATQTVTTADAATWDTLAAHRLEDLAGLVPGLQVDTANAGLSSAIRLRGFAVTRLLYNGQPDVQRMFVRDLATVDRIEVLSGPAGVLQGIASPGGAVNYVGKQPHFEAARVLRLGVDADGVGDGLLDLTGPLAGLPLAYRLVLSASDGSRAPAALPQRHRTVLGALGWAFAPGGLLTLEAEQMANHTPFVFGTVITGGGTPQAAPRYDQLYVLPGGAPAARRMQRWALEARQQLDNGAAISARWSTAGVTRDETLLGFWGLETDQALSGYVTRYHDDARQTAFTLRAEGEARWAGTTHRLAAGLDGFQQGFLQTGVQGIDGFRLDVAQPDFSAVQVDALPTTRRYSHEQQRDGAAWFSDRVALHRAIDAVLGWRHTRYRIDADRRGTGLATQADGSGDAAHLGLLWRLDAAWRAYAALSTGFEPNRGTVRDGSYLPPQRQRQTEAGLRWAGAADTQLAAAAFRIRLSQLPMTDPADRTAVISSGERAVQGLQAVLHTQAAGLTIDAHAQAIAMRQVVRTSAGLGDDFPGASRYTAGARLSGPLGGDTPGRSRWALALSAVGPRMADAANTTRLAGYGLAHLSVDWPASPSTTVSAGVRNLLDRRYVEAVTALDDVYQGPRRQAWVRLDQWF
jgi:iron complex outermembrane receptor protein